MMFAPPSTSAPTLIEESSPIVLRYKTPYFKASARVVMPPIPRNETWVVGWIQACNQMEFFNTYSDLGISLGDMGLPKTDPVSPSFSHLHRKQADVTSQVTVTPTTANAGLPVNTLFCSLFSTSWLYFSLLIKLCT
ncbi:protein FAM78A-like [Notamacropus eugenii]|uniref:protein FAM78A-like n=1 Tax=Notamacropus eugenii TaxID=9315 RepID=UPI003B67A8EC